MPSDGDASSAAAEAIELVAAARTMERAVEGIRSAFEMKHLSYLAARYGTALPLLELTSTRYSKCFEFS